MDRITEFVQVQYIHFAGINLLLIEVYVSLIGIYKGLEILGQIIKLQLDHVHIVVLKHSSINGCNNSLHKVFV